MTISKELRQVATTSESAIYLFELSDDAFDAVMASGFYSHVESSRDISDVLRRMYLLTVAEWLEQ